MPERTIIGYAADVPIELTEFERGEPFDGDADAAIASLQQRLACAQLSQIVHRKRAIILLEGWTGANKKSVLKRLVGALDPTHVQVVSVGRFDEFNDERHWLAPFWGSLPSAGDTTIFYRSWYRKLIEQRVLAGLDKKRWLRACDEINEFESQQKDHGTLVAKLFFHVTVERQAANLQQRQEDPWMRHLRTNEPLISLSQRNMALEILHEFFAQTDTRWAPWNIVDANDPTASCISALTMLAEMLEKAMPVEPPAMGETVVQFRQPKTPEQTRA